MTNSGAVNNRQKWTIEIDSFNLAQNLKRGSYVRLTSKFHLITNALLFALPCTLGALAVVGATGCSVGYDVPQATSQSTPFPNPPQPPATADLPSPPTAPTFPNFPKATSVSNADPGDEATRLALQALAIGKSLDAATQAPKLAFLNTFSSGEHHWMAKNIEMTYSKLDLRGTTQESWKTSCTSTGETSVVGSYPGVQLKVGGFACARPAPHEFSQLQLILHKLNYTVRYIPAFPSEPNQFAMSLSDTAAPYFRWKSQRSLNALTKENVAFFDFVGEENGLMGWEDSSDHYLSVSITRDAGGFVKMVIDYDYLGKMPIKHVDMKLTADLI